MKFIVPIISLGTLIFVHELGHFLAAIYFGIEVKEFAIGFGPTIFKIKGKLTEYKLNIFPLGGYVNIEEIENRSFGKRPFIQKLVVLSGGIVMNIVTAFLIFLSTSIYTGELNRESNIITTILSKETIFKLGDRVTNIDRHVVSNWRDVTDIIEKYKREKAENNTEKNSIDIVVFRNGENITLKSDGIKELLYVFPSKRDILGSIKKSCKLVFYGLKASCTSITKLFKGEAKVKDFSGPIGIVNKLNSSFSSGVMNLAVIVALISLSLAFFNALPIPPLDGGRLLVYLLEDIGIKISERAENIFVTVGFTLLTLLTILIGKSDVSKLSKKDDKTIESTR